MALKAIHAYDVYEEYLYNDDDDLAQVYRKSEADREIRKQKRKRCLAIAACCSYKSEVFDQYARHTDYIPNMTKYRRKRDHYADRCNKLLLLADKFKE